MKKKIENALISYIKKPHNKSLLLCNNGIFKLSFNTYPKPEYYSYTVEEYNSYTKKFECCGSYGSPFIQDIRNALKQDCFIN